MKEPVIFKDLQEVIDLILKYNPEEGARPSLSIEETEHILISLRDTKKAGYKVMIDMPVDAPKEVTT